jgi:hypothetical protein
MTSMTMPAAVERAQPTHKQNVSQLGPMLLAVALVVASAVVSVLLSGPMH